VIYLAFLRGTASIDEFHLVAPNEDNPVHVDVDPGSPWQRSSFPSTPRV
jgi:hypothetical protein